METNLNNSLGYNLLNVDENKMGLGGVKELSKANWLNQLETINLGSNEMM